MFGATASRVARSIRPTTAQSTRNMTALSGPPQVKISPLEKLAHGVALFVGMAAIPTWVLVNIKNYRGAEEE